MKITEVWKPIPFASEKYEVSNLGQVRTTRKEYNRKDGKHIIRPEHILCSPVNKNNGYKMCTLVLDKKYCCFYVHRLVAQAFITENIEKFKVGHKDKNKLNNCVYNLTISLLEFGKKR